MLPHVLPESEGAEKGGLWGAQESRRIDNQLRGRSGRQGDPGSTRYFLSLEDKCVGYFLMSLMYSSTSVSICAASCAAVLSSAC